MAKPRQYEIVLVTPLLDWTLDEVRVYFRMMNQFAEDADGDHAIQFEVRSIKTTQD